MSDTNGWITTERRGAVLWIGLDRPAKRNALTVAMYRDLCLAYGDLDRDPGLRCGVLFAHGDHFTAGLDLPDWIEPFGTGSLPIPEGGLDPFAIATRPVNKPVVIAVQGMCFTLGLELLLASDVRVAARDVRFTQLEVKRGFYPVGGGTFRLPAQAGWGNGMRYLLTGDEFGADEAYRMGLVQEVCEPGRQREHAGALADRIAAAAPLGVQAALASARCWAREGEDAAKARLFPDLRLLFQTEDVREGLASFLERREARFQGR